MTRNQTWYQESSSYDKRPAHMQAVASHSSSPPRGPHASPHKYRSSIAVQTLWTPISPPLPCFLTFFPIQRAFLHRLSMACCTRLFLLPDEAFEEVKEHASPDYNSDDKVGQCSRRVTNTKPQPPAREGCRASTTTTKMKTWRQAREGHVEARCLGIPRGSSIK